MAQAIKSLFTFLMHVGEAQNVTLDMQQLYLRLSHSMQYESMAEVRKHLSNFSLQKGADKKDLTMSNTDFEKFMAQELSGKFSWADDMMPKINQVIWRSLKSLQET